MRYEEATQWCLARGVDIESTVSSPSTGRVVVTLRLAGHVVRGAVSLASTHRWTTGFAALADELRSAIDGAARWDDEPPTTTDYAWQDEAATDRDVAGLERA